VPLGLGSGARKQCHVDNTTASIEDRARPDAARERLQAAVAGRFRVEGLIGRGLFSSVFRATGLQKQGEVALKVLALDLSATPGLQLRLENELRTSYRLSGDGVVAASAMDHDDSCTFLVLPLMAGGSLADRLRDREPIPLDEVVAIVSGLAATLDRIHAQGLTHRGLTPENILFDERGRANGADIGVSATLLAAGGISGSLSARARAYAAPELWRAKNIDGRADQYSLAMITYDMLTGGKRLSREVVEGIHTLEPIAVLPDVPLQKGVPLYVNAALRRALSAGAANRFATATDFAEALAGRGPDPVLGLPTTHLEFRLNERSRVATLVGAILLVISIAILADPALKATLIRTWRSMDVYLFSPHRRIDLAIDPSMPLAPSPPERGPARPAGGGTNGSPNSADGHANVGAKPPSPSEPDRTTIFDSTRTVPGDPVRVGLGGSSSPSAKVAPDTSTSLAATVARETKSWFKSVINGTWYRGSFSQSAYIRVAVDRGAALVTIDGIPRGAAPLTASVGAGHHTVAVVSSNNFVSSTAGVNASTGDTVTVSFRSSP
jgi:serine/threonine protein kinase